MPFDPTEHHRRSIRRPGYDYASSGAYFITICTQNQSCLFGEVIDEQMQLNDAGRMVEEVWQALPERFQEITLDHAVVMPNHFHGVVVISRPGDFSRGEPRVRPLVSSLGPVAPHGTDAQSLSRIIQAFKSITTTRYIEGVNGVGWPRFSNRLWQRDYFDHIIRTDWSLNSIRNYIDANPARWGEDAENPAGRGTDDVHEWVKMLNKQETVLRPTAKGEHEVRPYGDFESPKIEEQRRFPRIGHGYDLHRLETGPRLMLAGIAVSEDIRPVAHSDGDVVLHALVDALLGAMGWGDIGEHFANNDPRWKDAPSRVFVDEVYGKVRAAGYAIGNVDVTILAERPKLKALKPKMVEALAAMLAVPQDRVNVKAGTNEGVDAIGRGEAIAAHAVVLLMAV